MDGQQAYFKGMDQDVANTKRDPGSYFSLHNYRVVTDGGASTGSLESEKGTKLAFKLPDLPQMVLTDGTSIPAQTSLHIIGSTTMVDEIIIFSTSVDVIGYGQIWKFKFDEASNTIENIAAGDTLDPNVHLFYNQALNFSTEHRIGRAIALYETSEKQRVYWTDNYNQLRSFNLAAANPLDTPLNTVDLFPGATLSQPIFKTLGTGNLPCATQIQFTYKLFNTNGGETGYAPPTPLIPLPYGNPVAGSFSTWQGGVNGVNNKSVTYELVGLDTNFDTIEHVAIIYDAYNAYIWKFAEDTVPATGELTVTCTTLTSATTITIEEYSLLSDSFNKCKDIEVQGNRLIAANISTATVDDTDFDARAYRFNDPGTTYAPESPLYPVSSLSNAPIALLQDSNTNTNDIILIGGGSIPDWDAVPADHDCINIYNDESEANWFNTNQIYKYQADGTTLGGEGKFIKYEFTTKAMSGNTEFGTVTNAPNHIGVYSSSPTEVFYNGTVDVNGDPQPIYAANQIYNMSGIWAHTNYVGYSRGETYRFAFVPYDKQGKPLFVRWIGDIKFPDVSDGFPLQSYSGGDATLYQLGIKFTVDVSTIADRISGYSIVRLPREDADRTRLGTGFLMFFNAVTNTDTYTLMHRYFDTGVPAGGSGANDPFKITSQYQYFGDDNGNSVHLADRPGFTPMNLASDITQRLACMVSPFGNLYNSTFLPGDYIETLEYYDAELHAYYEPAGGFSGGDADFAFYYKMNTRVAPGHANERIEVQRAENMYSGQIYKVGDPFLSDLDITAGPSWTADLINASYCRDKVALTSGSKELHPLGIGSNKRLLRLKTASAIPGAPSLPTTVSHMDTSITWTGTSDWNGPLGGGTSLDFGGTKICNQTPRFKSIGYRRYLTNQYGGNSFESRSLNEYLYIGHYQSTNSSASYVLETTVFGGDTYVNYYDEEYIERYNSGDQNPIGAFKTDDVNHLGVAICGPVESLVNANWRDGRNWAKDRDASNIDLYSQNTKSIYPVWNVEDKVQKKFFAEDFLAQFVETHPNMLWASNIKINGELFDSWRTFPIANKTEVDGVYGPINRILSFKDNLMYYQDKAFGIASLDERSVIQDDSGQELVLGTGGVFPTYKYISTNTGTVHQFSVVSSESAVYHYDARLKKMYQFSGGATPLSDIKGLSSFFAKEVTGSITATDKTVKAIYPEGVHGVYDSRHNRVLYTFLNNKNATPIYLFYAHGSYNIPDNSYVFQNGYTYYVEFGLSSVIEPDLSDSRNAVLVDNAFTISYNELTQAYESFYDYLPTLYLEYGRRLFSVSPKDRNQLHTHNEGLPGQYYGYINSVGKLHTIFSTPGPVNKIWNNLSYVDEVYDVNDDDVYDETLNRMRFFNNYQDSGVHTLVPDNNIKRRMRTWRTVIPREVDKSLSRLRNPWLECILEFDNTQGYKHILHELIYSFTPTKL